MSLDVSWRSGSSNDVKVSIMGDPSRDRGDVEACVVGPDAGFHRLDSEGFDGFSSGCGGGGGESGGHCGDAGQFLEDSGRGADSRDGEEAGDESEDKTGEVDSIGNAASEGVIGIRANDELFVRESGVIGTEKGCTRGAGDVDLEPCSLRGALTAVAIVFRVLRVRQAADVVILCAVEGLTLKGCFLARRSTEGGACGSCRDAGCRAVSGAVRNAHRGKRHASLRLKFDISTRGASELK
jgi:hypothetical protein